MERKKNLKNLKKTLTYRKPCGILYLVTGQEQKKPETKGKKEYLRGVAQLG